MKVIPTLRRLALLRAAAALVVMMTGLASYLVLSSLPARAATSDTVLFIHGFAGGFLPGQGNGSSNTVPGGCAGTWGTAKNYFLSHGWTKGRLLTVGYYRGDWQNSNSCDIQFDREAPNSNHQYNCDTYHFTASDEGTNNQDLGNIACQLAWYIYNTYTTSGQNVHVIAHSMGGMIIRYALDRVYNQDPAFPPYLDVPTVVTMDSPHGGIPDPAGAWFACGGCRMISNLQKGTGNPAYFINTLLNESVAPMGSPGEPTQWTLMTSTCEGWAEGVPADIALMFPNGRSGYPVVYRIDYEKVPQDPGTPKLTLCGQYDNIPDYLHGDYLQDQSDYLDAAANPPSATVYHSLHVTYQNTAILVPVPPFYAVLNETWGATFLDKWWQMGGLHGALGDPTNGLYSVNSGWAQDFWTGGIYWSSATGTHEVQGSIYSEYTGVFSGPNGILGFPTTDEQGISTGRVSYFYGNLCGSRGPNNSGSAIYYSSATGAHQVGGCIYNKYWNMSGPNSQLSFPTSDVLAISGGYVSYFSGTTCGTSSSGSTITYSSTYGAHEVQGCIYHEYVAVMGGPSGALGFPVTDEQAIAGGHVSYFAGQSCNGGGPNGSGSGIFDTPGTGAHEVHGCIYDAYQKAGGPTGGLGFPVSDEYTNGSGNRESDFQGGYIIWNGQAHVYLYGCPSCS
jgi:pimeloyl-ACP methyl ester carboxylesterase